MKTRLPIQLGPQELEALRARAASDGVSMSAVIRRLLREQLLGAGQDRAKLADFLKAAGTVAERPGSRTVSRDHDRVLYGRRPR